MKMLMASALLTISSAFACSLENMGLYEIRHESEFVEVSQQMVAYPGYLFSQFESLGSFDYESCKDAIQEVVVQAQDGSRLRLLYTIEDGCDGGNSYGIVLDDASLAPVALIHDSDVSCL